MSARSRVSRTKKSAKTIHSIAHAQQSGRQRGGSSALVLVIALVVAVAAVFFLWTQMSKFKNGRAGDEQLVLGNAPADSAEGQMVSPTEAKKKGLLGMFKKDPTPTVAVLENVVPSPIPTATPAPKPIPKGQQVFTISQGRDMTGPLFVRGVVSNFATAQNTKQTVKIYFSKERAVQTVAGSLKTDTKSTPITMSKAADEEGFEVWLGEWMLSDTVEKELSMSFTATGPTGNSVAGVAIR